MLQALFHSLYYADRWRSDRAQLRERVEEAGGELLRFQQPGMFLKAPFPPLGNHPLYFKLHARHGEREGVWYVRTTLDQPSGAWVWKDAGGLTDPPTEWPEARVDNSVADLAVLPSLLVYFGVIGGFIGFLFWAYGFR